MLHRHTRRDRRATCRKAASRGESLYERSPRRSSNSRTQRMQPQPHQPGGARRRSAPRRRLLQSRIAAAASDCAQRLRRSSGRKGFEGSTPLDPPLLEHYTADAYILALQQLIEKLHPAMSSSPTPIRSATSRPRSRPASAGPHLASQSRSTRRPHLRPPALPGQAQR